MAPSGPIRDILGPFIFFAFWPSYKGLKTTPLGTCDTAELIKNTHVENKFPTLKNCNNIVIFYYI